MITGTKDPESDRDLYRGYAERDAHALITTASGSHGHGVTVNLKAVRLRIRQARALDFVSVSRCSGRAKTEQLETRTQTRRAGKAVSDSGHRSWINWVAATSR